MLVGSIKAVDYATRADGELRNAGPYITVLLVKAKGRSMKSGPVMSGGVGIRESDNAKTRRQQRLYPRSSML